MFKVNRRRFLQLSGFAFAITIPESLLAANSEKYAGIPMGVHGASFRQFSIEETLKTIVEELGLNEIELTSAQIRLHGAPADELATLADIRKLRRMLADAGVRATAYGFIPIGTDLEQNLRIFQSAQELELRNLTVIPEENPLDHLEELADRFGIRLAIHNNAPGRAFDSMEQVYRALAGRGENIGACVDVGNVLRSNEDPAQAIRQLGEKVFGIHLKDVSSRSVDSDVIGLGEGVLDTEAFFAALRETDMPSDMACSLEYLARPTEPIPNMQRSLALAEELLNR
ncbi:MAG: TIM barrel protein [Pseudomonadales bacterium]|nr:TIM barrel protein [Pseudomonadales bacterium]